MRAITVPSAGAAEQWGEEEAWDGEEAGQKRIHQASDIELFESRHSYQFWDEGSPDLPRPLRA